MKDNNSSLLSFGTLLLILGACFDR